MQHLIQYSIKEFSMCALTFWIYYKNYLKLRRTEPICMMKSRALLKNKQSFLIMQQKHIAWIIFSITICAIAALDLYLPAAPFMCEYFFVGEFTLKATFIVNPIVGCISGIPFGYYSDRFGRKLPLILAIALFLIGTIICAAASNIAVFFIGRTLQAFGSGGILVINGALLGDLFKGVTLARYIAIYGSLFPLIYALAPVFGAFVMEYVGWRWIFGANFLAMGLSFCVLLRYLPETRRADAKSNTGFWHIFNTFKEIMITRGVLPLSIIHSAPICFCAMFAINSSFLYINVFLFAPIAYSLVQATPVAAQFLGAHIYKSIVKKIGLRKSMTFGLLTTGAFLFLAAIMLLGLIQSNPYLLLSAVTVFSIGSNFMISSAATLLLECRPDDKGSMMSFVSVVRNVMIAVTSGFSSLFTYTSAEPLLAVMLCVALLQGILVYKQKNV